MYPLVANIVTKTAAANSFIEEFRRPFEQIGSLVRDFVLLIWEFLWIPAIVSAVIIGLSFFLGKDYIKWARSTAFRVIAGIIITLFAVKFVGGAFGFFDGGDAARTSLENAFNATQAVTEAVGGK